MAKNKGGILKKMLIALTVVFVVIVVAGIVVYQYSGSIAQNATERALEFVLQVDVSIGSMDIGFTDGTVEIQDLIVGNPEGFKTDSAFDFDTVFVKADLQSFTTNQPTINEVTITGGHITLEQGLGSSNLSKLVENAKEAAERVRGEEPSAEASKKIVVDKLVLNDGRVGVSSPILQGQKANFSLPKIELKDIGKKGRAETVAGAIRLFIQTIITEVLKAGGGVIPEDLTNVLGGTLEAVGGTGKEITDQLKNVGESLGGMFKKKEE